MTPKQIIRAAQWRNVVVIPRYIVNAWSVFICMVAALILILTCTIVQAVEGWRVFEVTFYCQKKCCCGRWADGKFASGQKVYFGGIAAGKNTPFGVHIEFREDIEGRKIFSVEDRDSAIQGKNRVDVFISEEKGGHKKALELGRKRMLGRVVE